MAEPEVVHGESLGGLLRGIVTDVRTLIREEIELARVEIREQAGRARAAAVSFAIADLLNWPVWSGFLIVAGLLSIVGMITLASGRRQLLKIHAVPEETVSTLKENSQWIAKRLSSVRK